jgi:uncharacterized membrane protein
MEKVDKGKLDISTILINILALVFLSYVAWMFCGTHRYLKVVAMYSLMMPKFISIWRAFARTTKLTDFEQWVFIILALICWGVQSSMTGHLSHLFH